MTTLDPLFRLLARVLSASNPPRLHEPISINELMDALLPYRLVRRELGVDTSEDYEGLILRLCAGEGGFAQTDGATQAALQAEAAKPIPDLALLRVYGDTHIVLRTDPLVAARGDHPEQRYAPPGARISTPPSAEEPEPGEEEADEEEVPGVGDPEADDDAWLPDPVFEANADTIAERKPDAPAKPGPPASGDKAQVRCPFCGGLLPSRMAINFCPHCGMGQDAGTCRACGADMDVGWRYCVSCGEEAKGGLA